MTSDFREGAPSIDEVTNVVLGKYPASSGADKWRAIRPACRNRRMVNLEGGGEVRACARTSSSPPMRSPIKASSSSRVLDFRKHLSRAHGKSSDGLNLAAFEDFRRPELDYSLAPARLSLGGGGGGGGGSVCANEYAHLE